MKNKLIELENILVNSKNPILDYLNISSFDKDKFINTLHRLSLEPIQELLDLYSWKTGLSGNLAVDSLEFEFRLFSFGSYVPYNDATSLYLLDQNTDKLFTNKFLPFAYYGIIEDPLLINLSKKSPDFGSIYYFCPNVTLSSEPVIVYDSLDSMIKTIIECYKQDAYIVSKDGVLEINDKESEISRRINGKSDYWNY